MSSWITITRGRYATMFPLKAGPFAAKIEHSKIVGGTAIFVGGCSERGLMRLELTPDDAKQLVEQLGDAIKRLSPPPSVLHTTR